MFDMLEKKRENSVDIYVSRGNNFYTVMWKSEVSNILFCLKFIWKKLSKIKMYAYTIYFVHEALYTN